MIECKLDHLVIAAGDLDAGQRYIEDLFGVAAEGGGRHDAMGTHNRLLRLGEDQYLEVIAIDPDAPSPGRPRWFALDDPEMRAQIRQGPKLVAWVARTAAIEEAAAVPPYDGLEIREMARGDLRWRMTFTPDGSLLYAGALPLLIEWLTEPTPARLLPDRGCLLKRLVIQSPQAGRVGRALQGLAITSVDLDHSVQTGLAATVSTPARGDVVLSSVTGSGSDE